MSVHPIQRRERATPGRRRRELREGPGRHRARLNLRSLTFADGFWVPFSFELEKPLLWHNTMSRQSIWRDLGDDWVMVSKDVDHSCRVFEHEHAEAGDEGAGSDIQRFMGHRTPRRVR